MAEVVSDNPQRQQQHQRQISRLSIPADDILRMRRMK
jgi:hypothetical protein